MKSIKSKITFAVLLSALIGTTVVNAGGFQLFEQSAAGLGVAQANAAAAANDPSTEYTNPAGMVRFKRAEVTTGLEMVVLKTKFSGSTDTTVGGGSLNPRVGTANGGTTNVLPNVHFIMPINDKWYYGAGLSVPFGASIQYGDDSVAAQYATTSSIQTINFSQDIAYAIDPRFSVGGGIDLQNFTSEFDVKQLDTIDSKNEMSSAALGWHIGGMFQLNASTRFGLVYHSQITQKASGNGVFDDGSITIRPVNTNFILPAWFSAGFYHELSSRWTIMSTLHYTQWSAIKSLTLNNVQALSAGDTYSITVPQNFHNTMALNVGTTYQFDSKWQGKLGLGYDQTPTNSTNRELRLPDQDKINLALGARYTVNDRINIDFAYEHAFIKKATINTTIPFITDKNGNQYSWILDGQSSSSADIIGVQASYRF